MYQENCRIKATHGIRMETLRSVGNFVVGSLYGACSFWTKFLSKRWVPSETSVITVWSHSGGVERAGTFIYPLSNERKMHDFHPPPSLGPQRGGGGGGGESCQVDAFRKMCWTNTNKKRHTLTSWTERRTRKQVFVFPNETHRAWKICQLTWKAFYQQQKKVILFL